MQTRLDQLEQAFLKMDDGDLSIYPKETIPTTSSEIFFNDTQGNSLVPLYNLLKHDIINLSEEDYLYLKDLYLSEEVFELTADHINKLQRIFETRCTIKNKNVYIYFPGDVIGDRGNNDLITILLFYYLRKNGLKLITLTGNHEARALLHATQYFTGSFDFMTLIKEDQFAFYRSSANCFLNLELLKEENEEIHDLCIHAIKEYFKNLDFLLARDLTPTIIDEKKKCVRLISHTPFSPTVFFTLAHPLYIESTTFIEKVFEVNGKLKQRLAKFVDSGFRSAQLSKFFLGDETSPSPLHPFLTLRQLEKQIDFSHDVLFDIPNRLVSLHGHLGTKGLTTTGFGAHTLSTSVAEFDLREGRHTYHYTAINLDNQLFGHVNSLSAQRIYSTPPSLVELVKLFNLHLPTFDGMPPKFRHKSALFREDRDFTPYTVLPSTR